MTMRMTREMTGAFEENAILYSHRHLELIANAVAEEYGGGYEKAEEIVRSALGITSIYAKDEGRDEPKKWLVRPYDTHLWFSTVVQPTEELRRFLEFKSPDEADDALDEIAEENEAWRDSTPEEDD